LAELENPSRHTTEAATILSRLESISSKRFSEITESLCRIEGALMPLSGGANSEVSITSGPNTKAADDLGYIILGLDDKDMYTWFSLFADVPPTNRNREASPQFGELHFDDFAEMQDVFEALKKIALKAKEAETQGKDRQQAFETAWKEEAISRASRYAMQKIFKDQEATANESPVDAPWLKYIIWVVSNHYNTLRGRRIKQMLEGEPPHNRDAHEVYFKNVATLIQIPAVINKAVQEANGDNRKFLELLFEALMRLRTFGPNTLSC